MQHKSPYNYKNTAELLKDSLDLGFERCRPCLDQGSDQKYKYFHNSCLITVFFTNSTSHLLLKSAFVLRKLQVYAEQLYRLKDRDDTEDGKLKMDTLIGMIGVFVKEKLSEENNDHFLRYRSIQCSKFHNQAGGQGTGDRDKLEQMQLNMQILSTIAHHYFIWARRSIKQLKISLKGLLIQEPLILSHNNAEDKF